ncbi:MAG: glycosyltransferase family 2 protein [Planctomycetota bacterium]
MRISVVIPVHNEEQNIASLLHEVDGVMSSFGEFEIVVVDDGSSDDSAAVLNGLREEIPALRVVRHQICCGQSTALMTGIHAAVAPIIATLDGDGQNDPADLPSMIERLENESSRTALQMVAGFRNRRRDSGWRHLCSRVANTVRSRILKDQTPDSGCGIKVFFREAFLRIPHFNHMHRFLPALILRNGGTVVSVPVNHRPRVHGRSHYGTMRRLLNGIVDLAGVAWLIHRHRLPVIEHMDAAHDERTDVDRLRFGGTIPFHQPVHRAVA